MHTLLPHKTEIPVSSNSLLNESEQIIKTTELTRRLKQLLLCLQTNQKAKSTCTCGHVCNVKLVANTNHHALPLDLNNVFHSINNTAQRATGSAVRDNSLFRQPFPIAAPPVDNFENQINSLMKIKPRCNNRQNRFMGTKQVVQRMLPLVSGSSSSNYTNYQHSNLGHQSRIVASRQLNFGADAAQNFPRKIETKLVDEVKRPILPVNSYVKSNIKHSSLIKNNLSNKQIPCTVVKEDDKPVESVVKNTQTQEDILTKDLIDDISIGSSTIAEARASIIRNDHLDELLDSSRTPESLSASCILNTPENTWFNSELHDFSLSSFLGHLESPIKPQGTNSEEAKICQDVDVNMLSLLNENSEDYMAKFAALAARISSENSK